MKIVFNLEKYSITVTEDNWDCALLPKKGDKVNLYWFVTFRDGKNVTMANDSLQRMNKSSKSPIFGYNDFITLNKEFVIEDIVWVRDYGHIYCQFNITD